MLTIKKNYLEKAAKPNLEPEDQKQKEDKYIDP
jgi:hypothetical protein